MAGTIWELSRLLPSHSSACLPAVCMSTEFWISYVEGFFDDDDGFFFSSKTKNLHTVLPRQPHNYIHVSRMWLAGGYPHLVSMALPRFGMKISKYHDSDISAASSVYRTNNSQITKLTFTYRAFDPVTTEMTEVGNIPRLCSLFIKTLLFQCKN